MPGIFDLEGTTPEMQRLAMGMGLAQAAQAVGSAPGGRRLGSYFGAGVGGYGEGFQSSINHQLAQQAALSGLLDDSRKRKEQDRLDKQRKKREKLFGDYRSGAIQGPLPPDVQKVMNQVYDLYGEEKASEFLLNYLDEDAKASLNPGEATETWSLLSPDNLNELAKRNIHLDPNEQWEMSSRGQTRSVGKVSGAEADVAPQDAARLAFMEDYVQDYEGTPSIPGDKSLKQLLEGDDEIDPDTGQVIENRPGIADWVSEKGINTSRLFNAGEWNKFERRMFSGAEALVRAMTGAGMNMGEAEDRARNYLPQMTDTAATIADKAARLNSKLKKMAIEIRAGGHSKDYLARLQREMDEDAAALDPNAKRKRRVGGY